MRHSELRQVSTLRGLAALSPAVVFLLLYVAVSLVIGDFYVMPVTVALLAASAWAIAIDRGPSLATRIERFSAAAGHTNILYMIWIFVMAGAFAALARGNACLVSSKRRGLWRGAAYSAMAVSRQGGAYP